MCVGVHFSDLSVSSDTLTVPWWKLHDVAVYPNLEFFSPEEVPIKEVFFGNFFVVECCLWFGGAGQVTKTKYVLPIYLKKIFLCEVGGAYLQVSSCRWIIYPLKHFYKKPKPGIFPSTFLQLVNGSKNLILNWVMKLSLFVFFVFFCFWNTFERFSILFTYSSYSLVEILTNTHEGKIYVSF